MSLDTGLGGKKALITGGARGIGLAIGRALACEGARLAIADVEPDALAIESLESRTGKPVSILADVSKEEDCVRMVRESIEALGGLDVFVNNAASAWHEPITQITPNAFYRSIDTNLAACVWACREAANHFIAQRSGSILIVGSTVRVCPAYREASYRISKMGLKMYMETLAIELAPFGIRVNMITPGHYPTHLTAGISAEHERIMKSQIPLRRLGDTSELGAAAALLLSDLLSSYTTGCDLVVDGGLSLRPLPLLDDEQIATLNS
jgi:glucose 1-dehydrogenase